MKRVIQRADFDRARAIGITHERGVAEGRRQGAAVTMADLEAFEGRLMLHIEDIRDLVLMLMTDEQRATLMTRVEPAPVAQPNGSAQA